MASRFRSFSFFANDYPVEIVGRILLFASILSEVICPGGGLCESRLPEDFGQT